MVAAAVKPTVVATRVPSPVLVTAMLSSQEVEARAAAFGGMSLAARVATEHADEALAALGTLPRGAGALQPRKLSDKWRAKLKSAKEALKVAKKARVRLQAANSTLLLSN